MLNNLQSGGWGIYQSRRTRQLNDLLKSGAVQRQFVSDLEEKETFLK